MPGLANDISRNTERFDPAIRREPNGDMYFCWPIQQSWNHARILDQRERIADAIGIEADMIEVSQLQHELLLHVPAEMA